MKKADLTKYGFEIEKEGQDKSGNTFIILGQRNNPLCILVRNQGKHEEDNFFSVCLDQRENINKLFTKVINNR